MRPVPPAPAPVVLPPLVPAPSPAAAAVLALRAARMFPRWGTRHRCSVREIGGRGALGTNSRAAAAVARWRAGPWPPAPAAGFLLPMLLAALRGLCPLGSLSPHAKPPAPIVLGHPLRDAPLQ